jgi:hypothetical protein
MSTSIRSSGSAVAVHCNCRSATAHNIDREPVTAAQPPLHASVRSVLGQDDAKALRSAACLQVTASAACMWACCTWRPGVQPPA